MTEQSPNLIIALTFSFSVKIVRFTDQLQKERKLELARQTLRSGTSIGANVREAQGAESKKDFVHKLRIAYKEAEETAYWLELIQEVYAQEGCTDLLVELTSIKKVLNKIISTTKNDLL